MSAKTALVLGGGGVTGVAWETGLLFGLQSAGVDLSNAELVIGTSAGAAVAAQLTSGASLELLYQRQLDQSSHEIAAKIPASQLAKLAWSMFRIRDPVEFAKKIGAAALEAETASEEERLKVIASRLLSHEWPERSLVITAINARTGELSAFDKGSGVPLVQAVAASCAVPGVWPPVTIGADRFIDGGIRSPVNADLAQGCERVVILAPMSAGFGPVMKLSKQVEALRAGGAKVVVVEPDFASKSAIGTNTLDPTRRPVAAQAGHAQAPHLAAAVKDVWATG
ncbi:MAG: patatin-like phospholipase family protein [Myxococcaceae bacterium]